MHVKMLLMHAIALALVTQFASCFQSLMAQPLEVALRDEDIQAIITGLSWKEAWKEVLYRAHTKNR